MIIMFIIFYAMCLLIHALNATTVEVWTRMSYYTALFYMDVIIYLYYNNDVR